MRKSPAWMFERLLGAFQLGEIVMAHTIHITVTEALKGDWIREIEQCYMDLHVDKETTLRLSFPDDFIPSLIFSLHSLQGLAVEQRRKFRLPALSSSFVTEIKDQEYWRDDINQIAMIRTRFQNGGSQDTPIEKNQIQQTIEFLTSTLLDFENQSQYRTH